MIDYEFFNDFAEMIVGIVILLLFPIWLIPFLIARPFIEKKREKEMMERFSKMRIPKKRTPYKKFGV